MSEQLITATPVNAPDILMNQPLTRQVDVTLETKILEPVSHNYASATGGRTTFVLPASGVLDAPNAVLRFALTSAEGANIVAPNFATGLAGCVDRVTLRCGGNIMSQTTRAAHYMNIKQNYLPHAVKEGVYDARHLSSHSLMNRVGNAKIATSSASLAFQQLYNPEADQVNEWSRTYVPNGAAPVHRVQRSKCIQNVAASTPEAVIRLGDLFEFLNENKLPLLAMAQVEIEIEWLACGDANVAAVNQLNSPLIDAIIPAAANNAAPAVAQLGTVVMNTPTLLLDYIHYDEVEREKIFNAVNSPGGMRLNFTEVLHTRGINPASAVEGQVSSNHILGMAMKEVKKLYVQKNYSQVGNGAGEINNDFNGIKTHRNELFKQYKSQQIPSESYNLLVNNERLYDKDVENPMVAQDYLSQCGKNWTQPNIAYDTGNYNVSKNRIMLDSSFTNGALVTDFPSAANQASIGASKRYLCGSQNFIGVNFDKYNMLGSAVGNGTRLGSSPLEFNYNRLAVAAAGAGAVGAHLGPVELDFYVCYRRSMIIRALGVDVSDA